MLDNIGDLFPELVALYSHPPCEVCQKPVLRRAGEKPFKWKRRRTCGRACAARINCPIPTDEIEEARRLARQGLSITEVSRRLGRTNECIAKWRDRYGITFLKYFGPEPEASDFWKKNQERLEQLAPILSAREIAEELGTTRKAVIGRARRTSVILKLSPTHPKPKPPQIVFPVHGCCQWIDGDPREGGHFCGGEAVLGKSWCHHHAARVFRPVSEMRETEW